MSTGSQAAIDAIAAIIKELKIEEELTEIYYRIDYQDYKVVFGDKFHCEIQERTIDDYLQFKHPDAKKDIVFRLKHLTPFEDWEKSDNTAKDDPEDKMTLDNDL